MGSFFVVIHHKPRMTLSDVDVRNIFCPAGEHQGPAVRAKPFPSASHFLKVKGGKDLSLQYVTQN